MVPAPLNCMAARPHPKARRLRFELRSRSEAQPRTLIRKSSAPSRRARAAIPPPSKAWPP